MPRPVSPVIRATLDAQHGVITRTQLIGLGASDRVITRLVRDRLLLRLHTGAYAAAELFLAATDEVRHCMRLLALQLQWPDVAAYGPSGAVVRQLPLRSVPLLPHVVRGPDASNINGAIVRRSLFVTPHVTVHAGLRVTSIAKTVVDVAAEVSFADALITVDAAMRRGVPLRELLDTCDAAPPVRRVGDVRRALEAGDPYAESWLESLSRGRIIERGMRLPLCNVVLRASGRWARVDFLDAERGVVGEADGDTKYLRSDDPGRTVVRERGRQRWVEDLGFELARWGTPEVSRDGAAMAWRLERAAARQARHGFTWPLGVQAEVPLLGAAQPPARVVLEVGRLAALGYPIGFTDARGRPVDLDTLST